MQIERFLYDVVPRERGCDSAVPLALAQSRAEINAVPSVIIIGFENKKRAISTDKFEQIDSASVACRLPIGDAPGLRQRAREDCLFAAGKPILVFVIN